MPGRLQFEVQPANQSRAGGRDSIRRVLRIARMLLNRSAAKFRSSVRRSAGKAERQVPFHAKSQEPRGMCQVPSAKTQLIPTRHRNRSRMRLESMTIFGFGDQAPHFSTKLSDLIDPIPVRLHGRADLENHSGLSAASSKTENRAVFIRSANSRIRIPHRWTSTEIQSD
jgi:hypothetical protein